MRESAKKQQRNLQNPPNIVRNPTTSNKTRQNPANFIKIHSPELQAKQSRVELPIWLGLWFTRNSCANRHATQLTTPGLISTACFSSPTMKSGFIYLDKFVMVTV